MAPRSKPITCDITLSVRSNQQSSTVHSLWLLISEAIICLLPSLHNPHTTIQEENFDIDCGRSCGSCNLAYFTYNAAQAKYSDIINIVLTRPRTTSRTRGIKMFFNFLSKLFGKRGGRTIRSKGPQNAQLYRRPDQGEHSSGCC